MDCYLRISCTSTILFSRALLRVSFIGLLCEYLAHFYDSLSVNFYVSISRIPTIFSRRIVTLLSRTLLRVSFIELLSWYVAYFFDSLLLDCYFSIPRTFTILFHWIVMVTVCRALFRFSPRTFTILFHCIVTLVSLAPVRAARDCSVSILHTFTILFLWIVTLECHTFL